MYKKLDESAIIHLFCVGKDSGKMSGRISESDQHDVGRFLNRILGLEPEIQNRSVNDIFSIV